MPTKFNCRELVWGEGGGFVGCDDVVGVEAEVGDAECCAWQGASTVDFAFATDAERQAFADMRVANFAVWFVDYRRECAVDVQTCSNCGLLWATN